MAFSEFYCDASVGANVNGGSDAGSPSMSDTAGTGAISTVTHQYTSVATNGTVTVGQFISIYSGAATVPAFTARITVVTGGGGAVWVITYDTTAISGTEPTTGATYKAKVGGAWKGPNAAENFPFGFITKALMNSSSDPPRVNLKNNATYMITAAITHSSTGPVYFRGYASTIGDGGKAVIDGGTSGASYTLFTLSAARTFLNDTIFQNNGASGSATGVVLSGGGSIISGCVANSIRGHGFNANSTCGFIECEAYTCNQSNTSNLAGIAITGDGPWAVRCISHDNIGSNSSGYRISALGFLLSCIADTNGQHGFSIGVSASAVNVQNCVAYNNTGSGIDCSASTFSGSVENCLLVSNSAYGINPNANGGVQIVNCAFYSNTSGQVNGTTGYQASGSITLTGDPFTAASTGNFKLNSTSGAGAACLATGRGAFTETQASYTGTASTPNVGACEVNATAGTASGGFVFGG